MVALGESDLARSVRRYGVARAQTVLGDAAAVVAVSDALRLQAIELGATRDRVHVVPNGADERYFFPGDRSAARVRLSLPLDRRIAVTIGSDRVRKGIDVTIAALDLINDPSLELVVLGSPRGIQEIGRVARVVEVDRAAVGDYLRAADVFVLPSRAEGSSNATAEAIACGTKVVVSDLPFNSRFVGQLGVFEVDPTSSRAVASAITAALAQAEVSPDGSLVSGIRARASLISAIVADACSVPRCGGRP